MADNEDSNGDVAVVLVAMAVQLVIVNIFGCYFRHHTISSLAKTKPYPLPVICMGPP